MKRSDFQIRAGSSSRQRTIDNCWGVPIVAAFSAFLLVMASSSYGYFYVLFMKKYAISHEQAAWPASALVIAGSCTCLVVSQIQYKVSLYHITLAGGILASIGITASAFAPNIIWMTVTFGVLYGAGIGTALLGLSLYILAYFEKYSGTAFAIMWVSRAASGMAATPLLWYLTANYGVEGCLLITGGLMIHVLPLVMLIKSPRPFCVSVRTLRKKRCKPSHVTLEQPPDVTTPSFPMCAEMKKTNAMADALASFRKIPFYPLVFYCITSEYIFITFTATVVAYAEDKGFQLVSGKQTLVYNAMGLLVGRVVIPFACDKIVHSRCPVAVASFMAAGACFLSLPHASTFGGLAAVATVMGVGQGYILCIKSVIISDYMHVTGLSFCAGVGGLLSIPLWMSGPSIIGFFRDTKGSYDHLYYMLAALSVVTAVQLAFIVWWDKRRRTILRQERLYLAATSEMNDLQGTSSA
ncbi:monocarboxylate transporter 13-like [Amblyomma americanum]